MRTALLLALVIIVSGCSATQLPEIPLSLPASPTPSPSPIPTESPSETVALVFNQSAWMIQRPGYNDTEILPFPTNLLIGTRTNASQSYLISGYDFHIISKCTNHCPQTESYYYGFTYENGTIYILDSGERQLISLWETCQHEICHNQFNYSDKDTEEYACRLWSGDDDSHATCNELVRQMSQ